MTLKLLKVSTPPLGWFVVTTLEFIGFAVIYSYFFMKQNLDYFGITASKKGLFIKLLAASLIIQLVVFFFCLYLIKWKPYINWSVYNYAA